MTAVEWLQEQYTKQITFLHREDFEEAKEMEKQQQDKFAIGFGEWCAYYQIGKVKDEWISHLLMIGGHYDTYTMKQLIERFKKERGL